MWIEVKKDIFEDADFKGLNFILQLLTWHPKDSIPRYNILVNSEQISHLGNYNQLTDIDKQIIDEQFDAAVTSGVKTGDYLITNKNKRKNTFSVEEAIMFLNQPVYLVLENSLNDRYFLEAIFRHFDKKIEGNKRKLIEYVKNNWIQFVNAGGWSNIDNYVKGQLKTYNYLSEAHQKPQFTYFRCFVMMDSDKEYPNHVLPEREQLKTRLESKGIVVHILKKRAMENYMPDEVINDIPKQNKFRKFKIWVDVYNYLIPTQKDYLNYKEGFPKKKIQEQNKDGLKIVKVNKGRLEQKVEIQQLYPLLQISDNNYEILDNGLKLPNFKDYFPTLFEEKALVNKTSLLSREGGTEDDNEFLDILQKIESLL